MHTFAIIMQRHEGNSHDYDKAILLVVKYISNVGHNGYIKAAYLLTLADLD